LAEFAADDALGGAAIAVPATVAASKGAKAAIETVEEIAAAKAAANAKIANNFYRDGSGLPDALQSSAGIIVATEGKTTTVLGRWKPDMNSIIQDQMQIPKTTDFGPKPGGFNILNVDTNLQGDAFWNAYNKPFLDAAIDRGDPIFLSTIPKIKSDILENEIPTGMFGREIQYLVEKNIQPVNVMDESWKKIQSWFGK